MIYIVKRKELYQNNVNSSFSTRNCKMDYWRFFNKQLRVQLTSGNLKCQN